MTTKERYAGVIKWFQENKPIAETELQYHDPFPIPPTAGRLLVYGQILPFI